MNLTTQTEAYDTTIYFKCYKKQAPDPNQEM